MRTDKLIFSEIRNGNNLIFEKVFHEHYNALVNFANQFLLDTNASEDVVQGAFIYLWENAKNIHLEKSIKAYLFRAVKNSCLNQLRALKIKDKHELLYLDSMMKLMDDEQRQDDEVLNNIKAALIKLPEQMSRVFHKKYLQELSIKEIAKEMSISENTVKVQLHKGRHSIRKILKVANTYFF